MISFNKKIIAIAAIVSGSAFLAVPSAFAQTASSSNILQDVQAAVQSLVSAKDTGNTNDVALRVTAFEQVLSLSQNEAQDYELKLVNAQSGKEYDVWKNSALNGLSQALAYYDSENQAVNGTSTITSEDIKQIASDFESWREDTYLPLVNQIQDFLLVNQETAAVKVAAVRYDKIVSDLQGLGVAAITRSKTIAQSLNDASSSIVSAGNLNDQATKLFMSLYVASTSTAADQSASSSDSSASTTIDVAPLVLTATSSNDDSATSSATLAGQVSTGTIATSTASAGQATSTVATSSNPISIKGLVKASLDDVRNAYQDFIDISNLVRSLLQ
ncbi:hypothetical protein M1432_00675 [Patescibacteria group bacterium]|nr:hypothetical protein [Patescibacteria group bacterium]